MAYNEKLVNRVREAITHLPKVKETKMAKGALFMVNEKVCISVGDDELMLRIDPLLHEELVETKNCRTMKMKDKEYKGYIMVSEGDIKNKKEFDYWINLALEFNKKAKASPKKKKPIEKATAKKVKKIK
jgi:hypothetical protein